MVKLIYGLIYSINMRGASKVLKCFLSSSGCWLHEGIYENLSSCTFRICILFNKKLVSLNAKKSNTLKIEKPTCLVTWQSLVPEEKLSWLGARPKRCKVRN